MKKIVLLITLYVLAAIGLFFHASGTLWAANSQASGNTYELATVDTAPGADGYATNEVSPRVARKNSKHHQVWFSIGGSGTMTVTLQFKRPTETTWTDYDTYTDNEYKVLDAGASNEKWRAIVINGDHTSGSKTFGFTW